MTVTLFANRAVKVAVFLFAASLVAVVLLRPIVEWVEANNSERLHRLVDGIGLVSELVIYAIALPSYPVAESITGPEEFQVTAFLCIGFLVWGTLIAAVWTCIEWLRGRRADRQSGTTQP